MDTIKENLKNTVHTCGKMAISQKIMIDSLKIWKLEESLCFGSISGQRKDWRVCPYCGLEFYEDDGK